MKLLNIITGISGSGKSHFIAKNFPSEIVISPDLIRKEITGNISDQTKNYEVWKLASERVKELLNSKGVAVLDALNLNAGDVKRFIKFTEPTKVTYFIFAPNLELSAERIKADISNKKERSEVSVEVLKKQFNKFINNVKNILALEGNKIFIDSKTGKEMSEEEFLNVVKDLKLVGEDKNEPYTEIEKFDSDTHVKGMPFVKPNSKEELNRSVGLQEAMFSRAKEVITSVDFKAKMGIVKEAVEDNKDEIVYDIEEDTKLDKELIEKCVKFSKEYLKITHSLKIIFSDKRKEFQTLAYYVISKDAIHVYVKGRILPDFIRSYFHEAVHSKQRSLGQINDKNSRTDNDEESIETEANSKAGIMCRKISKLFPEFYGNL